MFSLKSRASLLRKPGFSCSEKIHPEQYMHCSGCGYYSARFHPKL